MTKLQIKPVVFGGKMLAFAVFACFVVAGSVPSQVLANQSLSDCSHSTLDDHIGLYFRQDQVKQAKKLAVQTGGVSKAPAEPLFASKSKPLTFAELQAKTTESLATEPTVEAVQVAGKAPEAPDRLVKAVITAYTSTPDQTDSTPDIAASGKHVYDGMIAANGLPFGTKVKIPALYGDKIFTVDDRMNARYGFGRMDIWLDTTKSEAKKFGVKRVEVQIFYPADTQLAINK